MDGILSDYGSKEKIEGRWKKMILSVKAATEEIIFSNRGRGGNESTELIL